MSMASNNSTLPFEELCVFDCDQVFLRFSNTYDFVHKPLSLIIALFGVLSNVINIVVLTRREMLSPMNVILTGLSVAQLFLLLNYLSLIIYNYLTDACLVPSMLTSYSWTTYKWVNVNSSVGFHTTALAHTLCLAIFRFSAVSFPMFSKTIVNLQTARRCVVIMHLTVPLLCCPTFFTNHVGVVVDDNEAWCGLHTYFDLKYSQYESLLFSALVIYGVVFKLVPSVTIGVLSFYLISSLKNIDHKNCRLTGRENAKRKQHRLKLTKMFIIVALSCVVVEFPHGVVNLLTGFFGSKFGREVYDKLGDLLEMLTMLYSSMNFVLYCSMNAGFNKTFKRVMRDFFVKRYHIGQSNDTWLSIKDTFSRKFSVRTAGSYV